MQQSPPPQAPAPASIQLAALLLGAGPVYAQAIYGSLMSQQEGFVVPDISGTIANILLLFGLFGSLLLFAHIFICRDTLSSFNRRPGTVPQDIISGIALAFALLAAMLAFGAIAQLSGLHAVPQANRQIGDALAADPLLLALWLGPLVWLQAALFEELVRTFALIRLWNVWPKARLAMVVLSALPFGFAHYYQGWIGVAGTALIGIVLGLHYMSRGRFLPLAIAHGLYDSTVLLILVYASRSGLLENAV